MPTIRQLSQSLINKIAAGEVIERPASVVKELVENAVDAKASRIDVTIGAGGSELVRVVDTGHGIAAEQLPLALASHATSKLTEADDLFRVATLGFRGEALASIAEISRFTLRSRQEENASGAELEVVGGKLGEVVPCGCPVGTSVEVQNLFFNTPVRRKFLRTTQTEFGHVSEAFTRIALANPAIHFTLRHNDRQVFDLPATDNWLDRIERLFSREICENLIPVESRDGDVHLRGYVANPTHSRSNNKMQYLLLNGRHIRDRSLQHALGEAYRGLLMTGRYAIAFLKLDMPADLVDVNVHPTKLEVRFQNASSLYSQLLSTLRTKFLSTDLTPRVRSADGENDASPGSLDTASWGGGSNQDDPNYGDPSHGLDESRATELRQELVDWAKGEVASWQPQGSGSGVRTGYSGSGYGGDGPAGASFGGASRSDDGGLELNRVERPWSRANSPYRPAGTTQDAASPSGAEEGDKDGNEVATSSTDWRSVEIPVSERASAFQVHNRYLVAETDEGMTIIDQHALHERILYEYLRERVLSGEIEIQNLLVPEPVDLGPTEAAAVLENRELLADLGMRIEPFGGDTVLVAGYPAMLANINPVEVLRELVDRLLEGGKAPDRADVLDGLLHTIACKAAVKAGDRLAPEEITSLLEQRHLVADTHHCPHGRPTALVFTREELDKQFRRV